MYTIKYIMPHIPSKITIPHIIIGNWYWTSASPSYCTTVKALMRDRPESSTKLYNSPSFLFVNNLSNR